MVKHPPADAGDTRDSVSIPGSGRSRGGGNGNLLQCSCLENPMELGAWRAIVHGIEESDVTEATWHAHRVAPLAKICCVYYGSQKMLFTWDKLC